MAFTMDYSNNSTFELIPEGEYECIIERGMENATKFGTPYLELQFVVRRDVDQPQQGQRINHTMWMKKNPDSMDAQFYGYSAKQILKLSEAAGLTAGRSYQDFEEWFEDLTGRLVRVTVEHSTYNGRTNARVKWINATMYPNMVEAKNAAQANTAAFTPIADDDDVPF